MSNDYRKWTIKRENGVLHVSGPTLHDHEDELEVIEKAALKALVTRYILLQSRIMRLEAMEEDFIEDRKEAKKHIKFAWELANKNEEYLLAGKLFDILKKIDPPNPTGPVSE